MIIFCVIQALTTIPWCSFNGIGATYQFRDILPLRFFDFCPVISAGYWINRKHVGFTNQSDYDTEIWKEGEDEWFVVAPSTSLYYGGLRFGGEATYRAYIGSGFIHSISIVIVKRFSRDVIISLCVGRGLTPLIHMTRLLCV